MNLDQVQTHHLGKILNLQRSIKQRKKRDLPVDRMLQEVSSLIEHSARQTDNIRNRFSNVTLQPDLPITGEAEKIKQLLGSNQVVIVAGETGCGKTTQLPKICLQAGYGSRGLIGHTQPRRVAATSVAKRIAEELNSPIGEMIGYSIRFSNKMSQSARIKLMTDGVLLTEIESDPLLSRYQVIIIDEAHERSLNIDFLLGFLKQILVKRKDLKLIITSATIDPLRFSKNFDNAPIVTVEGRSYPVEIRYRPPLIEELPGDIDPLLDNINLAVEECIAESPGDILIFADGEGQIKSIVKQLQQAKYAGTSVLPLYARLSISEQQKIFKTNNQRKIIVSTNVAETSLTVPGIVFVIDIGTARISRFSQRNKIQQLPIEKISRASADQRKGRCGRIAAGICIRLYAEDDYQQREEFTCAEISRTNLSSVALRLKAMGVKQVEKFPFMEVPKERAWNIAFNSLFELGAINREQQITKIGKLMAQLPVDPQLARILVEPNLSAVNEMLIICSLMSVREIRERPHDKQQKADQHHKVYQQQDSDILTAIQLWRQLEQTRQGLSSNAFKQWCRKNFINFLGWLEWRKVYFQLKEAIEGIGVKVNTSPVHDDDIHRALIPGFVTHIFCRTQEVHYQGVRGLKVWIHPSSLCFKKNKPWLLSAEMIETEKLYARMNATIQPQWIINSAQHLLKSNYQDIHWRKKNGQVMAYLNQTLLGLPVVNQKLVNYSSVDSERCRNIFLKEGVASDQLSEDFPFLRANREKLTYLSEQEQRQRLNNIRLDSESLAQLYATKLPQYVCSLPSLKKWLMKDSKHNNKKLMFSIEQLTENKVKTDEAYPSQIRVKGFNLNLNYCFAPGAKEDGVSVEIPDNMVTQFTDRDFDWLVPGYLEEKVLTTLKSLPKALRRDLIPLNETAVKCKAALSTIDQADKLFIEELAKVLQRQTGKQINVTDFNMQNIEPHLTMKYKVIGRNSTVRCASLVDNNLKTIQSSTKATRSEIGKSYTTWQFGDFEIEKQLTSKGHTSRVFQGLYDCGKHVEIKEFPSQSSAQISLRQGIARLLMLKNQSQLNQFFNSWPEKSQLERLSIRFDGFRSVFDSVALRWGISLVKNELSSLVCSEANFIRLSEIFSKNFRQVLSDELNSLLPLIQQREKVFSQIADLRQSSYQDSIEDMKLQLKQLWSPDVLLATDSEFFNDYARYHKGLNLRIKRIQSNYPKEQQALDSWLDWQEWWSELKKNVQGCDLESQSSQLFWALQEFRISLFSPGTKVKGTVSAKKLQKRFEQIESQLV